MEQISPARRSSSGSSMSTFVSPLKTKTSLDNLEEQLKVCQTETVSFDLVQNLNLPLLPSVSEPHLIEFLRKCFKRNIRFLTMGPLIVTLNRPEGLSTEFKMNVFDSMHLSNNDNGREQVLASLAPNFPKLAFKIFSSLSQTSHGIFFLGDTGGGKSRCLKEFCSHLILLSSILRTDRVLTTTSKHPPSTLKNIDSELKIFEQANSIVESFGNSQIAGNYRSSRSSKAVTLSFNSNLALEGLSFRCFHLEFTRTAIQSDNETNFRIFYDIFDDIFFAEHAMNKYSIDNLTSFRYTAQRPRAVIQANKSSYKSLAAGFQTLCGLSKGMQNTCIYNVLAAILHLGDIEIEANDTDGSIFFSSDSKSTDHQSRALKLLGLPLESLLDVVTKKSLKVAGSVIETKMDITEARSVRDTFACHIYAGLFRWILSKINVGLTSQFPINLGDESSSNIPPGAASPAIPSSSVENSEFHHLPICHLYDLMRFESTEHNQLDQLCVNYASERIVLHFHQAIFVNDRKVYENDNIAIPEISYPDNTQVVRTLDNRTNGLFLLCEEQLRLKGSTDQKLAQYFYGQNSSNKCFFAAKAEQKNSEFIIKHYVGNVKYEINGFLSRNRGEVSPEIIACLKSSSIQFIREELVFHIEKASGTTVGSRSSISSIPETASTDATDPLPTPVTHTVTESRPSLVKSRSAAFINDTEKSPGRGFSRASSMVSRNGSLKAQTKTLTQVTVSYMNEIITEAASGESHFCLCLKLNNTYDPTRFDPVVVANQLRPYNILEIMSFYSQSYPHRIDLILFVNIFSPIALITCKDIQQSKDYLCELKTLRAQHYQDHHNHHHQQQQNQQSSNESWRQLCASLVKLIPDLPEFDYECEIIRGKSNESKESMLNTIVSGINVGQSTVYLTGLSYYYLSSALQLSIRLLGLKFWHFYTNRRFNDDQKIAGMKIGALMKKFLCRREAQKKTARLATIAMTQLALKRMREAKKAKVETHETPTNVETPESQNPEILICPITTEIPPPPPPTTTTTAATTGVAESSVSPSSTPAPVPVPAPPPDSNIPSLPTQLNSNESLPTPPDQVEVVLPTMRSESNDATGAGESAVHVGQTESSSSAPTSNNQMLMDEQEALIRSLRDENISLKRQLITLSSMLAEASRPQKSSEKQKEHPVVRTSVSFSPPPPPTPPPQSSTPPPLYQSQSSYKPTRKVLKTQTSSLETFSIDSVYGGDLSKDLEPTITELQPEYEVFVERTLRSLQEDISYLLVPTPFYKFGRTGSCHQTFIQLTPNFQSLTWVPHNTLTKSRNDCVVHLRSVWRLVEGQATLPFESYKGLTHGPMNPQRSFSIIYGFRSLDLCALDDEIYRKWFSGLRYILQLMNGEIQEAGFDRQYLRKKWNCLDKKNCGFLSRREVIQLIAGMDILFDRASFTAAVMRSTIGHSLNNEITFSQFDSLLYQLRRRPDLEIIWNRILNGYDFSASSFQPLQIDSEFDSGQLQEVISVGDVRAFWKVSQGRDLTDVEAKALIAEGMGEMNQTDFPVLSYNGFMNIMTHMKNDGYDPVLCVHHARDMNYPLQHYFISCSDGVDVDIPKKEIKSNSLLEDSHRPNCYANAINSGCRALELRCYEAKVAPNSNVDVFVGSRKVTSRITFKETMILIQRIAFLHTPLPLILMLEISCGIEQQKRMATILQKIFGDSIFTPLEAKSKLLPSPADLKHRVVIFLSHRKKDIDTAYKIHEVDENENENENEYENDSKLDEFVTPLHHVMRSSSDVKSSNSLIHKGDVKRKTEGESNWFNDISYYSDLDSEEGSDGEFSMKKPLTTVRLSTPKSHGPISDRKYHVVDPEISPLRGNGSEKSEVGAIDSSLMRLCHYSKGQKLSTYNLKTFLDRVEGRREAEEAFILENMVKFSCIYMDAATKSYGSYGGICTAWDCGVSMVSICREYPSLGTKIIHGKYRQNGGCGYILKPEKYRFQPTEAATSPVVNRNMSTLAVHIISGQELPEAFLDTETMKSSKDKGYAIVLDLNGAAPDQEDIQAKTLYIRKHGRNPFWNELFTFGIQDQSRGQLTLRVFHNEECVCFTSVPLSCLRVGFRSMTMFEENEDNNYQIEMLPLSKLFVRIGFLSTDASTPGTGGGGGGGTGAPTPALKSDYSKEFSPSSSPSPPGRSHDHNSRMVGMDVSPGNKHWKRLKSRGSDVSTEEPISSVKESSTPTTPPPPKHRHSSRRTSTGDDSQSRSSHRERRRSKRDKAVSRGQSIDEI